jgi:hypothetical protein
MAKTPFGNDRRTNPNADSYRDSHADTNSHSYRNAKCNPESYTYSDIYAYTDTDSNCHGQSYTKEYSDPKTSAPTAPPTDAKALGRMQSTIDNK